MAGHKTLFLKWLDNYNFCRKTSFELYISEQLQFWLFNTMNNGETIDGFCLVYRTSFQLTLFIMLG